MKPPDNRPCVLLGMPTRGYVKSEALRSEMFCTLGECRVIRGELKWQLREQLFATVGESRPMQGFSETSLLAAAFNHLLADALTWNEAGAVDYFLLHHDDIEIVTHGWIDIMVREMRRVGAAILSVVVPIKGGDGEDTSTALHLPGTWNKRKLSLPECHALPETFDAEMARESLGRPGELIVNSGVLLIDLARPEFHELGEDGYGRFCFTVQDRLRKDNQGWHAETWSEDWDFSSRCNTAGLPVWATTKIEVIHHGGGKWSNQVGKVTDDHHAVDDTNLTGATA